ncbi:helix-turn-helix transcriptional regulator [Sinomicrobium soli]|uniref:helix-turn-helix transcriptional regulator n=1 Tax=Sinomicrobium sp. N-1-3-6 TaxID=2219864 RepID=UPI000DCDF774|nr:AraC family transcriptional regulator [Sinomicrobium sp. N-1-3-6]RAV27947.1 hypothetical protein DN748_16245 [Sinomicrobium sp. N-1-3-6]
MPELHIDIDAREQNSYNFGRPEVIPHHNGNISLTRHIFDGVPCRGWLKEIVLEDFKLTVADLTISEKYRVHFSYARPTMEMFFVLQGSFDMYFECQPSCIHFTHRSHNLLYTPGTKGYFDTASTNLRFICIQPESRFLQKFLPGSIIADHFRKKVNRDQPCCLADGNSPITPDMDILLNDIFSCPVPSSLQKTFLYARMLDLLVLQTRQYSVPETAAAKEFSPADREKINRARSYLSLNFGKKITLPELAKKIGTNEFLLKNGFRTLFGTTVFGFIHDLRMSRARQLLLEHNYTISQVSDITGYKNPQHFSTAFKKKFGVVPSRVKRMKTE